VLISGRNINFADGIAMNVFFTITKSLGMTALMLFFSLLIGCSTTDVKKEIEFPVYPPPPDEPRFHYERMLKSSANIEKEEEEAVFKRLLTGEKRSGVGMSKPFGITVHKGRVFVSDTAKRLVHVFDVPESKYFEIGTETPGNLLKPIGIDTDAQGHLYVIDATAKLIQVYDRDGNHILEAGERSMFSRPSGIAVDPKGTRIYVVDTGGVESTQHQVLVFDAQSGEHLYNIGKRGSGEGELNLPREAIIAPNGMLYVVDGGNFRVQVFTPEGEFVSTFGSIGRRGGQFSRPKGIDVDSDGNIYVADAAFGNFQIFNEKGQLLLDVGSRNARGGFGKFMLPSGVAVDEDGRVYMADQYLRKVEVFRPHRVAEGTGYLSEKKNQ